VDIRIGIVNAPRELSFESDQTAAQIADAVNGALAERGGSLQLRDDKGTMYVVPSAGIAYVEIGSDQARRVGFVA